MKFNKTMWAVQGVLALLFLFAAVTKLMLPVEAMQQGPGHFPGGFLRFIGVAEVLGALGLILPGLLRIQQALTPVAAAGLTIIMIGATTVTALGGTVAPALFPFIVGALAASIAYGRSRAATFATSI
jgi:hypothetical protein